MNLFPTGLVALAGVVLLSACGTASATSAPGAMGRSSTASPSGSRASTVTLPTTPDATPSAATSAPAPSGAPTPVTPPSGASWTAVGGNGSLQVARTGSTTLLWMDPTRLRFRYVPGTLYPERSPATTADRTPSTWVPTMLAAFNSGYKLRDHVGGFYYLGRTVAPLRAGLAAFAIRRDGSLAVGVWGRDLTMTPDTVVVRQNLVPLVMGGVPQASAADTPRTWGIANGNAPDVNRSALGRLPDGSFVFEYGHAVTALDMAQGLVSVGVVEAVMLDMNKSWPTGFVYHRAGSTTVGTRIDPRIVRDPSTYLKPFKKDFVVVAAR